MKLNNGDEEIYPDSNRIDLLAARVAEVAKAREKFDWKPGISFNSLKSFAKEMVRKDLEEAKKDEVCLHHGFKTFNYYE